MTHRSPNLPEDRVADCHVRAATDVLSHRWDGVVLAALGDGPRRRVDLRARIGQVRDKPLTEALARLLAAGLISRREGAGAAPGVVYELTPLGRSFHDGPLQALATWAQRHGHELSAGGYQALP
ncbi:winged helix-turn-helix transcriptional regulator [Occultella kanbiaonis]|uniref:winged helix-turn-helix transcriptional regulator n=1 Tax=Occultella kanbiaonis TaxID=2675754 RepID=UPI001E61451C|nr:helix-turn-helix domain-containing protein [Occultella kanbiaonis]